MGFFLSPLPFQIADSGSDTFNRLTEVLIGCLRTRLQNKVRILYSTRGIFPYSIPSYGEGNDWVGTHGEYVLYILSRIFADPTKKELKDYIIKWASKFGLDNLTAGFTSEGKSEGKLMSFFFDSASKEYINTAYAGFGSRQALVLLVQLLLSAKNDMILIEEPEMSLHPAAQLYLPQLFAEIINQQKNIILTTHSEFLILALSNPIQRKLIRPSDVAVYNLQKGPEGTEVKSLEIGENGYIKGWIPSFTKVETELMQEFLKTVPET
jgi:hypothetical protein